MIFLYLNFTLFIFANIFLIFFSIELQSFLFIGLLLRKRDALPQIEACLRYLLLSIFSGCFFCFGLSFFFFQEGVLSFTFLDLMHCINSFFCGTFSSIFFFFNVFPFFFFSFQLIGFSFLFKLGFVPFHFWTVEIYKGIKWLDFLVFSTYNKFPLFLILFKVFNFFFFFSYGLTAVEMGFLLIFFFSLFFCFIFCVQIFNLKEFFGYSSFFSYAIVFLCLCYNFFVFLFGFFIFYFLISFFFLFNFLVVQIKRKLQLLFEEMSFFYDLKNFFSQNIFQNLLFFFTLLGLMGFPPTFFFFLKMKFFFYCWYFGYALICVFLFIFVLFGYSYYLKLYTCIFFFEKVFFFITRTILAGSFFFAFFYFYFNFFFESFFLGFTSLAL